MLLAALGFSIMGGAAKSLKGSFSAGQLVFYRNLVGLIVLVPGFIYKTSRTTRWKIFAPCFSRYYGNYCSLHVIVLHSAYPARNSDEL